MLGFASSLPSFFSLGAGQELIPEPTPLRLAVSWKNPKMCWAAGGGLPVAIIGQHQKATRKPPYRQWSRDKVLHVFGNCLKEKEEGGTWPHSPTVIFRKRKSLSQTLVIVLSFRLSQNALLMDRRPRSSAKRQTVLRAPVTGKKGAKQH